MKSTICKNDLLSLGYKPYTAMMIIRQAKQIMVQKGYPFYNNKRLSHVPRNVVEEIIGVSLEGENHSA
ncbi:Protein of uncharacterised function (DUF3173) [Enterococcus casseliflavus]|uniref:DUF3173 domain-containing protein n=1 Tax=Enterococcus casseliflavus TaxID=37734 RepID=UPI0009BED822|nr:DUF3173 domain-containing protein [Enterococcus casseliflavus]OQO83021.1 DUF3173 domain-containing protein [Enterococcus casseliflavus]GEB27492.1 hypothetical protein ECA02_05870 [Enterococcus casseliflavus]STP32550.1 Protein of uncharacterised function (DUF3173) [Enterococcus casseliflavus]